MGFRDLGQKLLNVGQAFAEQAKAEAKKHIRLENSRTLFLSDWALTSAIQTLGKLSVPDADLRAEPAGPGYRVHGKLNGKAVSALLVIESIRFEQGALSLEVRTPEGVQLEARPIANFFAGTIGRLFGGKWLGAKLFSLGTPEGLSWDGERARLEVGLEKIPVVGKQIFSFEGSARVRSGTGGLLVEFDDEGVASQVEMVLSKAVWDLFGEKLTQAMRR